MDRDREPTPLLCLHGFTLTGAQFTPLSIFIDRPIVAPDLPGHAESVVSPELLPTLMSLEDVIAVLGPPVPVLGYSMGGRIALALAVERPDLVERLIVVSATAGIADESVRVARAAEDDVLADRIVEIGLSRFLDEWLLRPLTSTVSVGEAKAARDRAVREENTAEGLASALRGLGQGRFPYLGDRLRDLSVPLLAVSGSGDDRNSAEAATLAASVPDGRHIAIEGVGHNVVLEAPERLAELVKSFLDS